MTRRITCFTVRHLILGILGYPLLTCALAHADGSFKDVQVQGVQDQTITFTVAQGSKQAPPKTIKTGLYDLSYIGALMPHDESMPYFLFAGNPCKTCSAERALYLIRPNPGSGAPSITSFVQPGKIFDPKSRALVMESRAFYGNCLPGHSPGHSNDGDDVYVVFQKERVDRRHKLQSSVFLAEASPDFMRERLIERGLPSMNRTIALVRSKKCHEIETRNRLMVLKPHGLNWRNVEPSDADDDDQDAEPRTDVE